MARLTDLSSEILLLIVQLAMVPSGWRVLRPKDLSLVNKRLNALAGIFIFKKYKLVFRGTDFYDMCGLTRRRTEEWDDEGVRARFIHLRSKATCVKHLTIVDGGEPLPVGTPGRTPNSRGPPLPSAILPELLETLRGLTNLKSIALNGFAYSPVSVAFPEALWAFIAERKLRGVGFGMHFTFGAELAPWTHVRSIKIKNFNSKWSSFLEVLRPAELTIEYKWEGELYKFVPYPGLKKLDVTVPELLRAKVCQSFFDFVKTPDLEFSIYVGNPCEYKFHIMGAWRALRKRLPIAFHDINLAQFNVRQVDRTNATIRSVKEGEKVRYQDQIPNARKDREDKELSAAYVQRSMMKI